jgi:hypothetical protein
VVINVLLAGASDSARIDGSALRVSEDSTST